MEKAVTIEQLDGGDALIEWFGAIPSFHDATLLTLELRQAGDSLLRAPTFRIGPEIDAEGYFVQTKSVVVNFHIFNILEAELFEFMEAGIMDGLVVHVDAGGTELSWGSSYGVYGRLKAKEVTLSFEPTQP